MSKAPEERYTLDPLNVRLPPGSIRLLDVIDVDDDRAFNWLCEHTAPSVVILRDETACATLASSLAPAGIRYRLQHPLVAYYPSATAAHPCWSCTDR